MPKPIRKPLVASAKRYRCPSCRSPNIRVRSTPTRDDSLIIRKCKCKACGAPFTLILD
jgi:transcriptional regulator NrdR family protein